MIKKVFFMHRKTFSIGYFELSKDGQEVLLTSNTNRTIQAFKVPVLLLEGGLHALVDKINATCIRLDKGNPNSRIFTSEVIELLGEVYTKQKQLAVANE